MKKYYILFAVSLLAYAINVYCLFLLCDVKPYVYFIAFFPAFGALYFGNKIDTIRNSHTI